eukprot:11846368-Alexandrium_andersonii.AAC.1
MQCSRFSTFREGVCLGSKCRGLFKKQGVLRADAQCTPPEASRRPLPPHERKVRFPSPPTPTKGPPP